MYKFYFEQKFFTENKSKQLIDLHNYSKSEMLTFKLDIYI